MNKAILLNRNNKTIVAMVLMAALVFAIAGVSSLAAPVFAVGKPAGVPPDVSNCGTIPSLAGLCAQLRHPIGPPFD